MSHKCDDCGQAFNTLSRLRLHECPGGLLTKTTGDTTTDTSDDSAGSPPEDSGIDRQELEADHPGAVGDLPNVVNDARNGDIAALSQAIAEYDTALQQAPANDIPGDGGLHHDVLFAYFAPLAAGLDKAAQTQGWDVLLEFADAYDPQGEEEFPEAGHVVANAIGRSVIRTRQAEGVETIPPEALAFLGAIPEYVDEFHVAHEESYTYGWGIGHPEHSVADYLLALAQEAPKFVKVTLNTTFYVDQHAALDVFETLVTSEDISGTRSWLGMETDLTEFYFKAVADLETEDLAGPHAPPYWEEGDNLDRIVELDPEVKQRIRELAHETGLAEGLPADWSLQDLEGGLMSEMLNVMNERDDEP